MTSIVPRPSWDASPVVPADVHVAVASCRTTLLPAADRDWIVSAGSLVFDCRATLDHIGNALAAYVRQLATHSPTQRPRFPNGDPGADDATLLDEIDTLAHVLKIVAGATPPDVRAYHSLGMADAEGFVAMGGVETLAHTWDIAQGLSLPISPPADLVSKLLRRLFPWSPAGSDPWPTFLYATGRLPLGDLPQQHVEWGWHAPPLAEWAGGPTKELFTG